MFLDIFDLVTEGNMMKIWFAFVVIIMGFSVVSILLQTRKTSPKKRKMLANNSDYVVKNMDKISEQIDINTNEMKKARQKALLSTIIIVVVIAFSFIFTNSIFFAVSITIILFLIFGKTIAEYYQNNENKYDEVISNVLKDYDNNLEYSPRSGVSKSEYLLCFFPERCDRLKSEDMIVNKTNGFRYSDILVESEQEDEDGDKSYDVEYSGSLARIGIKNVNCRIFLGSTRGDIAYKTEGFTSINFENDEFNKLFRALSDNELLAYKLLTPDVMEEFVNIKNNTYGDIDIRIIQNHLYIRFLSGGIFDSRMFNKKKEKEEILQSIAVLEEVMHTMEKVKEIINNKDI